MMSRMTQPIASEPVAICQRFIVVIWALMVFSRATIFS